MTFAQDYNIIYLKLQYIFFSKESVMEKRRGILSPNQQVSEEKKQQWKCTNRESVH